MKKSKKFLSLFLAMLMIITSVPLTAVTSFAAGESLSLGDATDFDIDFNYYTNDPKKALSDLSDWKVSATNSSMPNAIKWVHVTSIDGLRNALTSTSKDSRYIVIDKDIIVRYGHTKWDTISIKSDKVIDLNGRSIVLHYNRNKYDTHDDWKECYGQSHNSADFKSVMFDITNSTTNIIDTSKDKTGLIYTDAYMINPFENDIDRYTTRDIFTVSNGGNLVVYGGTFQAGRSKQQSSEKTWDKIKTAIGSVVALGTSIAGYATGINGATGALKDANINAETAFKNLQAGNNSGQTDTPSNNSDEGGTQKKTGANSVEENKQQTPQNEVATLNQTIGQKQESKNSGASASAPARRLAPSDAGSGSQTGAPTGGQTGGQQGQQGQTGGQQGQQGQNGQNNANAQGSAKYTGNSDIAKAQNEVINKATDSTAINGMVNAAFDMVDKIGAVFSFDSKSIVTQSFLGTAVTVGGGGTFVSYGGKFVGYGMTPNTRNAVIECTKNGRCYIYGGTFEGYCGANIFNIVQATNSAFTSKQWVKDESGKVTTKDVKVEVSESGGYKALFLEPDSTDENIKLIDTSCVQVRGGTFRCYYEYSMVGLHDGGEMTKFPGTSGSVNLGTTSFNEDFIRDGRIQVNDNYGDGALVLMDDKLTDNTIHHYRLFCGDDELRYKQYLTVSPLNGGSNSSYSLSLVDRYNNKNSGVLSKAFGMADDEDNERGVYSNDELCFNFEINSKDTGNYYVVPNLTNTDVRAENLDESEVWYYQTPTSSTGQKLNNFVFGYNQVTVNGVLKSSGEKIVYSNDNQRIADYPNAVLRQFSSTSSVKYEDYTKNYFNTLKWFTYNVYKVDPLTRENIGNPIITTVYGASNDSIKCRLPLSELGINYQPGEMYRVEFSVSEYAQFGWGRDNARYEGTTSLDTATAKSSIVFLCHDKDELITKENGNGKTVEFTPLQWVDEPQPGKVATVKLVNGGAGLVDWTKRKIFDVYYQWFAVDSEGHTTMIAGTDNIYRNKTFVDSVQGDYADHRFSRFTPETDQFNYANTIDPKHPLNTELDENNLPVDTDKWTNELVHAYLANTTEREALALDKSAPLSLKNNDRTYSASDSCYIPEEYSDCQFYVKCIAVNMNWQTIYDFVQTFSTHYTGADTSKVTVRYDANGVESSELDSYKIKQYGSVKTTIIDGSFMNKTGYVFAGWSKDKTNQTVDYTPGREVTFTESTTLYAVWKKGINVKFVSSLGNDIGKDLVDGSYVSKTYREYNTYSFEEITVPGNGYVTDNYRLSGWSSNGYGTTAEYEPGDVIHPTTDMTLYAVWGKKNPAINFDANGGSFPDEEYAQPQEVIYGQRARIKRFNTTDIMPVKDHCEFIGWSEDANATVATYSPAGAYTATYLKKDITLYAVWKAAPDKVNALNVSGIETPVLGQSLSITTNPVVSDSRFSATVTKWEEVDAAVNKDITKATVITDEISPNADSFYKVYVEVTPNDTGSTQLVNGPLSINGVRTETDFRINGNDARLEEKGEDGKFTFSCIFAPTIPNNYITEINIISSSTISLSADQSLSTVGAKFTVPSTANYTRSGNVSWKTSTVFNGTFSGVSAGNFVNNNYYKAVITLNAKSGYKFYENCKVASVPYFEGGVVEHISDTQVRVTTYQKKSIGYVISNVAADGFAPQYIGTAFNKTDLTADNSHCKVTMGTTATSFDGSTGDLNDCDHYVNVDESGILTYRWVRIRVTVTADIGYVVNNTTTITVPGAKSVEYVSSKTGSSSTKYSVTYDVIFEAKEIPSSNIINSLSISGVPLQYTDGELLDYDFGVISNTEGVTISKAETGKLYKEMYESFYSATKPFSYYPNEILVVRLDVTHSKDTTFGKSVGEKFNVSLVKGVETIENEDGTTQSNLVTYDTTATIEKITGNTARIAVEIYQDCFKTPDIIANISYDLTGRIYPACAETSLYGQGTETGYHYNKIDDFYTMPKAVTQTAKDFSLKLNDRSISIVDPETHERPDKLEIGKSYAIRVDFNYKYPVSEDALFDFGNEYGISKVILTTADSRFCQYSGYAVSAPVFKYEAHAGTIENQSAKFKKADATCNSPEEYYYQCELCREKTSETYTVGVALDHNSNGVTAYNETQHYTTCTRCDEPINPQYHTFTSSKLSDGRTKYTCSCGYSYTLGEPYTAAKSLTIDKNALTITEGTMAKLTFGVTPSNASVQTVTFSSVDESVATVDQSGNVTAVAPGMAIIIVSHDEGKLSKMCTVTVKSAECSHVVGETVKENVVAPTCSKAGSHDEVVYCSICSAEMSRVTVADAKRAHTSDAGTVTKQATCSETGTRTFKCTVCGDVIRTESISKIAHTESSWITDSASSCTSGGSRHTECIVCGEVIKTETIPAGTHSYVSVVTQPTCTTEGYTTYVCSVCRNSYVADNVPALGHISDAGTVTKKATCTATGTKTFKCVICDEVIKTETIKKTAHKLVDIPAVEPTCSEAGKTEGQKCSVCGTVTIVPTDVAKKAHTYKNVVTKATLTANGKITPTCTVCGATKKATAIYMPKTFTLSATKATYTGKAIKPTVTVKDSKGNVIDAKYYTVTYADNTNVGTATVTIKFKTNYSGTKTLNFTIAPKQVTGLKSSAEATTSLKLTWTKVTGAKYYKVEQSMDGKTWTVIAKANTTNSLTVSKLKAGTKYQFRVTALDSTKKIAGKASAVLKTGTLTAAPTIKLTSTKKATATVTITKVTGATKYTVYKSTDNKKWTKVGDTTKLTYDLTKLSAGKKIYVKVVAVNAYGKASAYSSVKNVTVKK